MFIEQCQALAYLHFGQDGHNRHHDGEDEVETDEDLVCGAVVVGVVDIQHHDEGECRAVEQQSKGEQSCSRGDRDETEPLN